MKRFGSFEDVYKAFKAYDEYCDNQGIECERCRYDLLSEITGIPCSFFWTLDNCFNEKQEEKKESGGFLKIDSNDVLLKKKILKAFHGMMDVMAGKKPSEGISEFSKRKCEALVSADELIGELEDVTNKE